MMFINFYHIVIHSDKIILIVFFLLLINLDCFSQPQTQWVQRFNSPGNYNDYVTDMAIDKSGNVYLTGYVNVNETNQDYVTIKYNTQGVEQWVRYYDGLDHREDKAGSIAVDDSGNVIVTGYSYSYSEFDDILTIKYNSNGELIWIRKFIGVGQVSDRPKAMVLDKFGDVYVTGSGITCSLCPPDILTIKYNRNGNYEWVRYYNGPTNEYDEPFGMCYDKLKNVYIAGRSNENGSSKGIILKYNTDGEFKWRTNLFSEFIYFRVATDDSNFVYSCGHIETNNNTDISISKFDSTGLLKWNKRYNRSDNNPNPNDYFKAFYLDRDGNVYVTGINSDNLLRWDIATLKYNSEGDSIWTRIYGIGTSNDESNSITTDKFGNVYVAGGSDGGLFSKFVLIKYSPIGSESWTAFYNNNNPFTSHIASKVLCDSVGNVYISGISEGNGTLLLLGFHL